MDGYLDGYLDGWIFGWMDGYLDGWIFGWMDGWMDGYLDGWMDGYLDGWMGVECLPFNERAGVRICFAVEGRQDHGHDDAGQEEEETPANRSPESVLQSNHTHSINSQHRK